MLQLEQIRQEFRPELPRVWRALWPFGAAAGDFAGAGPDVPRRHAPLPVTAVLAGVDLTLPPGTFAVIEGLSGSGKSTLLAIAGCIARPTSGAVRWRGQDVARAPEAERVRLRAQHFGFVLQAPHLLPALTALENVLAPRVLQGRRDPSEVERAEQLLAQVGLAHRRDHLPSQLSGGEQRRVSLARALINDPQVIFADEPTAALDPQRAREVLDLLAEFHRQGRSVLMVTHDPVAAGYAQARYRLEGGRLHLL